MQTMNKQLPDLHSLIQNIRTGQCSALEALNQSIEAATSDACRHVFMDTLFETARSEIYELSDLCHPSKPLAGLAVSVKDLFDIQGQVTKAGSIVLKNAPPATSDATAVTRLRQAGACLIGRTNMSEFAFSGVGVNPHYGTPANAVLTDAPRIPGGSSSGAAISVATGAAHIGLGTDTGGSIRIPAALNGLVGFKSTARLVPKAGALPLSTTLDTVCAITRSVRDAILAHEVLSGLTVGKTISTIQGAQLAYTETLFMDSADAYIAETFDRTLKLLRDAGAQLVKIELPELKELTQFAEMGNFSAAESFTWHQHLLREHGQQYDPRVALRMQRGAQMSASDYLGLINARSDWMARMHLALHSFDALISPTVPILPPAIAEVAPGADCDDAFFKINALLLRNPSVINMLDGCAISIPCHALGAPPCGMMIWHTAMHDERILNIALEIERLLNPL